MLFVLLLVIFAVRATQSQPLSPKYVQFETSSEICRVYLCAPDIVRIFRVPSNDASVFNDDNENESLIAKKDWEPFEYNVTYEKTKTTIETSQISLIVSNVSGQITFRDAKTSSILLQETQTTFLPSSPPSSFSSYYTVEQSWTSEEEDGFYGGGQYQNGLLNYKNAPIRMVQFNTEAAVPFFVSMRGRGLSLVGQLRKNGAETTGRAWVHK